MNLQVSLASGVLEGCFESGVFKFLGIPYAAPPTGDLRWRAPQDAEPWKGVRKATSFGPRCPQTVGASFNPRVTEESEDCLYLNIWTSSLRPPQPQPVMVWIHGGGNLGGDGSEDATDGTKLASGGVLVVSFNYRLGAFGFLAHPSLGANFGLLDQIAALRWVKANIARFGGDPGNVTVFGQSAGADAVRTLLSCPVVDGCMHRAILQSAGFDPPAFAEHWSYKRAEATAETLFAKLGSKDPNVLRAVPTAQVKTASHEISGVIPQPGEVHTPADLVWMPVPDGEVFTRTSVAEWPDAVPALMGYTTDEARYFVKPGQDVPREVLVHLVERLSGPESDQVLQALDRSNTNAYESLTELFTSAIWSEPALATLHRLTCSGHEVYAYVFGRVSPGLLASGERAKHTAEIRYIFGTLSDDSAYDATDVALSLAMQQAWIAFARTGVPTLPGNSSWPRFINADEEIVQVGDTIKVTHLEPTKVVRLLAALRDMRQRRQV